MCYLKSTFTVAHLLQIIICYTNCFIIIVSETFILSCKESNIDKVKNVWLLDAVNQHATWAVLWHLVIHSARFFLSTIETDKNLDPW
jgi:hypothetical protein